MATGRSGFEQRRLRSSYFSVVVSMTLVLFMLGVLGLLLLNAEKISDYVKAQFAFTLYLKANAKRLEINTLQKEIRLSDYTRSTRFTSREQAAKRFQKELGQNFMDFLGYNPLLNAIDVQLKADYVDPKDMKRIAHMLSANPIVENVVYERDLLDKVTQNVQKISVGLLVITFAFSIIAIALISSAIRLSIYTRRFLIKTMQRVGATKRFIRRPFLYKGVELSLLSSFLALIALTACLFYAEREFGAYIRILDYKMLSVLYLGVIASSIVIAWISTYRATSRFLNLKADDLYY